MNRYLFELIQVAIGCRKELTRSLSADEWALLSSELMKQSLQGIGYCGITRLPAGQIPPMLVLAQWMYEAENIRQKNEQMVAECVELCRRLEHDGFDCCILKGQSNLVNYPEELRAFRTPGDIDVLMRSKVEPGSIDLPIRYCITQCRLHNVEVGKICYHHTDMPQSSVEAHYRASWLSSPLCNHRLQDWLECNMPFGQVTSPEGFPIPTNSYNAIYQMVHIFRHLFEEGIGLRQLLDYYFVLRSHHMAQVLSNVQIMNQLKRFGLDKFASAVMYVLQEAFAMPDDYLLCPPNEKEGKWLLNEILISGNFGCADERPPLIPLIGGKILSEHVNRKLSRALMLVRHYPHEALWQPWFMVYHWLWRRFELWKK